MTAPQAIGRIGLILLVCTVSFGAVGCSTIRLGTTSPVFLDRPVDLDETRESWSKIKSGEAKPAQLESYDQNTRFALAQVILDRSWASDSPPEIKTVGGTIPLKIDAKAIRSFHDVDEILIADNIRIRSGFREEMTRDGIGVPLLARRTATDEGGLIPDSGLWFPLTGIVIPKKGALCLKLIDPTQREGRNLGGQPLAANFTAPLARDMEDRQHDFQRVKALLNFEQFSPFMGMQRVFEFCPDKKPIVFVHGVFSSSTTWNNTLNELIADPEIRENYEFWTFTFPTGAPIPYLSHQLRLGVCDMLEYRRSQGASESRVTLVGHSMGGMMSKTLTQHSGSSQWNQIFTVPPSQLPVSGESRNALRDMFFFEPMPCVARVIFTATPHYGAVRAEKLVANVVDDLIDLPTPLALATKDLQSSCNEFLTPLGEEIIADFPNSIEQMRYDSELGRIFADIPLNPKVCYHSVIGSRRGLDVPREEMTDGVVEYIGAHIEGVASEKIVHSDHGVHASEDGIREMIRILKCELGKGR